MLMICPVFQWRPPRDALDQLLLQLERARALLTHVSPVPPPHSRPVQSPSFPAGPAPLQSDFPPSLMHACSSIHRRPLAIPRPRLTARPAR
jgi:hypothetical protein